MLPLPLAANAIDTFARPSQQVLTVVEILHVTSEEQLDASTDIVTLVVPDEGDRSPYVLFSAYQFNCTDVPLACAGTESEVLLAPPFTLVPDVRVDVLEAIVYVTT